MVSLPALTTSQRQCLTCFPLLILLFSARPYMVHYSKIPITYEQLEHHTHCRVSILDSKGQAREFSVFPPKNGTVADILQGAQAYFEFAPNGTRTLRSVSRFKLAYVHFHIFRLVQVSNTPSQSRVLQVLDDNCPVSKLQERLMCHTLAPGNSPTPVCLDSHSPIDILLINHLFRCASKKCRLIR